MMSSISTQQSNVLQQIGAVQPPPPPQDVKSGESGTASTSTVQVTEDRPPPPPPEGGHQMGDQSVQPSGADMQSVLQGLLDARDDAVNTAVATMSAASGYGTSSAIFA